MIEKKVNYNILYVAPLPATGTSLQRMHALEEFGHKIFPIDTRHGKQYSLYQRIRTRILGPADLARVNQKILAAVIKEDFDLIWIDKGITIFPKTLKQVKKITSSLLLHHSTDDFKHVAYSFCHYIKAIPLYDIHITSNKVNIPELYELGAQKVSFSENGYDHQIFHPVDVVGDEYKADIFFIGHWEPNTEKYIVALVEAGLPVSVRGERWDRAKNKKILKNVIKSGPLNEKEYVKALCSGKIGLGVVSKWNRSQTCGRIFEIPACGTFLLALRNSSTQALYREGIEAGFFSSSEELVQKARYYLEHDTERKKIALAGNKRCVDNKCSWWDLVKEILAEIDNLIEAKKEKKGI